MSDARSSLPVKRKKTYYVDKAGSFVSHPNHGAAAASTSTSASMNLKSIHDNIRQKMSVVSNGRKLRLVSNTVANDEFFRNSIHSSRVTRNKPVQKDTETRDDWQIPMEFEPNDRAVMEPMTGFNFDEREKEDDDVLSDAGLFNENATGLDIARQFCINSKEAPIKWRKIESSGSDRTSANSTKSKLQASFESPFELESLYADSFSLNNSNEIKSVTGNVEPNTSTLSRNLEDYGNDQFRFRQEFNNVSLDVPMQLGQLGSQIPSDMQPRNEFSFNEPRSIRKLDFEPQKSTFTESQLSSSNSSRKIEGNIKVPSSSLNVVQRRKPSTLPPGSTPYLKKEKIKMPLERKDSEEATSSFAAGLEWNNPILQVPKDLLDFDWR